MYTKLILQIFTLAKLGEKKHRDKTNTPTQTK